MLKKLLMRTQHKSRLWSALAALCIGTTLLLVSVMIWWNFNELLYGKRQEDTLGSTFLIIGKTVTQDNMGKPDATVFHPDDIEAMKHAPQVQDVGVISSNRFPVYAMMSGNLPLQTDLPLESVDDKFLDKQPENWNWQPGSRALPIIVSSEFLNTYNYVFAPSQGLPQLSESSVKSITINLKVGAGDRSEVFSARVAGFSDRITSVLVPQSFIDYGNKTYGKPGATAPSQLILKVKDPSDTKFANYLNSHNYNTNSQNLLWSKLRAIVEVVTSATGILALMLMGIGTLVFILFIELTIAHAQHSLTLLIQVGYSPHFLSRFMIKRFLPMVFATVGVSMILTLIAQMFTASYAKTQGLVLPSVPGWPVWAALAVSTGILGLLVTKSISGAIKRR